ncbi:HisA/HisF-related TIM barrel protein [Rhodoligotrophos defluvii]|uniref:HisA/HisF-related TIM barrel protein n=1 Tax=Rhodoligotrophos defluvii TaxID=2561934 RepID=UPI001EEFAB82|nr:HisA/HisF-related TIM barrel protein [Rhodoligotrophos defluvii]
MPHAPMDIIPVLDVKDGLVVHARRGERSAYRPIETPLSASAAPGEVLAGLLGLHPFRQVYIADLDAIQGTGDNREATAALAKHHPEIEFWIDRGTDDLGAAQRWLAEEHGVLVLGSESQRGVDMVAAMRAEPRVALSLDFRGDDFIGPSALLSDPGLWPSRLIVMTLARVGSGLGPDLARLRQIKALAGDRMIIAAGGIRDAADLTAAHEAGAAAVLVATALHDGRLQSADLAAASAS